MNIGVIGLGKLGCSMFAAFAANGNKVFGYDINTKTRKNLKIKKAPVSETDLAKEIELGFNNYTILDRPEYVVKNSEVIYIIVPTPSLIDGTFDTQYLENVIENIKNIDCDCTEKLLVITSTVLPGDTRSKLISKVRIIDKPISSIKFCYSPEFIALGSVIKDLKNPDFLLVGEETPNCADSHIKAMMSIIEDKNIPVRKMSIESAEMAKISINAYITSKISFANAIGLTAESITSCCPKDVLSAIGSDSRIGSKYLSKGLGFGGPCFPRDNRAIQQVINRVPNLNYNLPIDNENFNKDLPNFYAHKIQRICDKKNIKNILIVGLTYKDGSYLLEESQAYSIALKLSLLNKVFYFDPDATSLVEFENITKFEKDTDIQGSLLLLNCSRDIKKIEIVKKIITNKNQEFIEVDIWK